MIQFLEEGRPRLLSTGLRRDIPFSCHSNLLEEDLSEGEQKFGLSKRLNGLPSIISY